MSNARVGSISSGRAATRRRHLSHQDVGRAVLFVVRRRRSRWVDEACAARRPIGWRLDDIQAVRWPPLRLGASHRIGLRGDADGRPAVARLDAAGAGRAAVGAPERPLRIGEELSTTTPPWSTVVHGANPTVGKGLFRDLRPGLAQRTYVLRPWFPVRHPHAETCRQAPCASHSHRIECSRAAPYGPGASRDRPQRHPPSD